MPLLDLAPLLAAAGGLVAAIAALIKSTRAERRYDGALARVTVEASESLHRTEAALRDELHERLGDVADELDECRRDREDLHARLAELAARPCPRAGCPIGEAA